jgi:hypothetical protein
MRSKPGPPMTLADMRLNGVHAVTATCQACGHQADVNIDALPETRPSPRPANASAAAPSASRPAPPGIQGRGVIATEEMAELEGRKNASQFSAKEWGGSNGRRHSFPSARGRICHVNDILKHFERRVRIKLDKLRVRGVVVREGRGGAHREFAYRLVRPDIAAQALGEKGGGIAPNRRA